MIHSSFSWFLTSLFVMIAGGVISAQHFPNGFDWAYTVASALMSQKHNPAGSSWFAVSLSLSMLLLWPYVSALQQAFTARTTPLLILLLRLGLVCGFVLGLERLFIHDLSHWLYKGHEALALMTFLGLYFGILGLLILMLLQQRQLRSFVLLVVVPLLGVSLQLLWLYLSQRELGWVDASWRERGIPVWLSFAFWQWWMIGFMWLGLGVLSGVSKQA